MKGLKTTAIWIILIGGILCIVPIIIYSVQFGTKNLATDTNVWGVFGDFIGGTINPLIGLVNLALLAAISFYAARFDNHRQFNEYRYQAYIDLRNKFDKSKDTVDGLEELKMYMSSYLSNNQFLFPKESNKIFHSTVEKLIQTIDILIPIKEDYEEGLSTGRIRETILPRSLAKSLEKVLENEPKIETKESRSIKDFHLAKEKVLGFIQTVMIEGNFKQYQ